SSSAVASTTATPSPPSPPPPTSFASTSTSPASAAAPWNRAPCRRGRRPVAASASPRRPRPCSPSAGRWPGCSRSRSGMSRSSPRTSAAGSAPRPPPMARRPSSRSPPSVSAARSPGPRRAARTSRPPITRMASPSPPSSPPTPRAGSWRCAVRSTRRPAAIRRWDSSSRRRSSPTSCRSTRCRPWRSSTGPSSPTRCRPPPSAAAAGRARRDVGSTPQGQGHRTMAAQVRADRLGWPLELIDVGVADTTHVGDALVTGGSRTAMYVGNVAAMAGREARRRLLELASEKLEAASADIVLDPVKAVAGVLGVPARQVPFAELLPEGGLQVEERYAPERGTAWGSSAHGAVVSLDPDTGKVEVERYVIAHDIGRSINPMTVEGQLIGGLVHGLGIALLEEARYVHGQLVTGSFLDYSTPTAPDIPREIELLDC